jgi:hypothetical protein
MHGIDTRKSVIPCDVVNAMDGSMKFIHFYIGFIWCFIASIGSVLLSLSIGFDREKLKSDVRDKWISEGGVFVVRIA